MQRLGLVSKSKLVSIGVRVKVKVFSEVWITIHDSKEVCTTSPHRTTFSSYLAANTIRPTVFIPSLKTTPGYHQRPHLLYPPAALPHPRLTQLRQCVIEMIVHFSHKLDLPTIAFALIQAESVDTPEYRLIHSRIYNRQAGPTWA